MFTIPGKTTKMLDIDKEFSSIRVPLDYTHRDRLIKQINSEATVAYKCNSGYIPDLETALYMQEFLASDDVYWLKNSVSYPVLINSSKNVIEEDGSYLREVEFEVWHAVHDDFTNDFSGNQPISDGDFNDDFNDDFDI